MLQLWGEYGNTFESGHSRIDWNNRKWSEQRKKEKEDIVGSKWFPKQQCVWGRNLYKWNLPHSQCLIYCSMSNGVSLWSPALCQNFPNSQLLGNSAISFTHTASIISFGIICWLALIIYNPFFQRWYTNTYLFPRIKSLWRVYGIGNKLSLCQLLQTTVDIEIYSLTQKANANHRCL